MTNSHRQEIIALAKSIETLDALLNQLRRKARLSDLLKRIRQPGYTTPAEFLFTRGIVEVMTSQAQVLVELGAVLTKGSGRVAGN